MSCVNNIDQKNVIHAFIIPEIDYWSVVFVRWSNNLFIWFQSARNVIACLGDKSSTTEACHTFSSFSVID